MVDTWHDVGHTSNLSLSWDKSGIRTKRAHFLVLTERERRREKEESQGFLPRSTEFHWSVFVGPRMKAHRIDKGYAWVPEKRDFVEVLGGEISGNRSCLEKR